jgi:hypothetical protein
MSRSAKDFGFSLFSLTHAKSFGWNIRSKNKSIVVNKDNVKIVFEVAIETGYGGMLLCAVIEPGLHSDHNDVVAVAQS